MTDYTPTTEEVRDGWVEVQNAWWPGCPDNWDDLKAAEFDRWLAEVKAQAWDEGQLALLEYMRVPLYPSNGDEPRNPKQPRNPYRQEGE